VDRNDADTIARMLDDVIRNRRGASIFPGGIVSNLGVIWINEIEKLDDAAVATQAVAALFVESQDRLPTPADLKAAYRQAAYRQIEQAAQPAVEEAEFVRELPMWVKGWLVARAQGDMRVWPEQKPGYDLIQREYVHDRTYVWGEQEPMPDAEQEEWEKKAAALSAAQVEKLMAGVGL
jgi:hypothetical protein